MDPFYRNKWFNALVFALLSLLILYMLITIRPIFIWLYHFLGSVLGPFLIAMIISYVLNPVVRLLNRRRVPRTVAVLLIYAVFITSLLVILMNVIPMFIKQLNELNQHLPEFTVRAQSLMETFNDNRYLPESVRSGINKALARLENGISLTVSDYINGIGSTLNMVFIAFIIPFLAFYMLKDFQMIERGVLTILPKNHRKKTVRLLTDIDAALGSYVRGQFIVCMIVGILSYIGYWMIGINYPLLLASFVSLTNIIPYLGPYLGALPAIGMAAMVSWKMVLYVVIVNMSVQILESNVISPQVMGKTLHMHPLTIIFVLLVGGELAGVPGLVLAVPVFAAIKVLVLHLSAYYVSRRTT